MWHDDTAWTHDRRTRNRVLFVVVLVMLASIGWTLVDLAAPPTPPDVKQGALSLGTAPAEARWYYTCRTDRHKHRHFKRGKTHIWKNIVVIRRGGNKYVRGTWATFDWGRERIVASDRRTYGPC
jgi:hypothetical protein